ncbi:hypothetical protein SAMN05216296_1107 [Pseudomonas pohangensis]|uniref:Uncharacterized protein n=1 Tax=Pseudomonas pohangensis TaxID=364197 RepID=A0A1H2EV86_9PSED|nr:hypothetical protein SAMN05216296_1107 [Pseudomonas pohangensis]
MQERDKTVFAAALLIMMRPLRCESQHETGCKQAFYLTLKTGQAETYLTRPCGAGFAQ